MLTIVKSMKTQVINPNDPRIIKTKKQFLDAFKELVLFYDDYMKISVKELCDKAGLNRKTFYSHYKQVDDLFLILQNEFIEDFYKHSHAFNFFNEVEKVVDAYFVLCEKNPVYKKMVTTSVYFYTKEGSRKRTIDYFNSKGKKELFNEHNEELQDILYRYYHMTIYIMYKHWVLKKYPLPKEEMVKITAALVKDGLSSIHI